jgi:ATP-dependent Clp protease ATP-binding subunit ClpC
MARPVASAGGGLFERFTDPARRVVVFTQEEARLLNHNYIGTEHILLGLIHEGEGVAGEALESLNISLEAVRQQVEYIIGRGQAAPTGHIPFTPRAKKVLELSMRESLLFHHSLIGTEHILLGLVREGEGVAAQILQRLGADLDRVRDRVRRIMAQRLVEPEEEMPATGSIAPDLRRDRPSFPLEEREKIVLTLLALEGLTVSQVAEALGVSKEKVREIVQVVIEKLKSV